MPIGYWLSSGTLHSVSDLWSHIETHALEMGFCRAGIAPAGPVPQRQALLDWLASGSHAGMEYMAVNIDLPLDPSRLLPGAQSVICLAAAYPAGKNGDASLFSIPAKVADSGLAENREASLFLPSGSGRLIARYAAAHDYHKVLKRRCHALMDAIREVEPTFEGRAFVDSADHGAHARGDGGPGLDRAQRLPYRRGHGQLRAAL